MSVSSRRSSPAFEVVEIPSPRSRSSRVILKNRGIQVRSDQLANLRRITLDLALDDYDYSQNEAIRVGIDWFLGLDIVDQIRALDALRERERVQGVGISAVRPAVAS